MNRFPWLHSEAGQLVLQERLSAASQTFAESTLEQRLAGELQAFRDHGDGKIIGTLWRLPSEVAMLCAAEHSGLAVPEATWAHVNERFIAFLPKLEVLNWQGRENTPRWSSDLTTAEVGVVLALALHLDTAGHVDRTTLEPFVRDRCLQPVLRDWLESGTRLHALDTMGHNWWSVMVGGAGIMAAALGEIALADRIANALGEWCRYPGSPFARKGPTFGEDGDFVESFHYADYGLYHPIAFSYLHPAFRLTPDGLSERQIRGLARWLRHSILLDGEGYPQMRFGDIQYYDGFLGLLWQTVARLAGDNALMEIARRIRPEPRHLLEILFWNTEPVFTEEPGEESALQVFSHSGISFMSGDDLRFAARAGEFWGHNHLDAGSFIFHQQGVTWIDDAGACEYGRPEYTEYYVSAAAHNVAYAPALCPASPRGAYEGLPSRANYLLHSEQDGIRVLCADTGILSGGALARSHRWFLGLDDDAIFLWDDLVSYRPEKFQFRLHCPPGVEVSNGVLTCGSTTCSLDFHANVDCTFKIESALMGQISGRGEKPYRDALGKALIWETESAERAKFGLVMTTRRHQTEWLGQECRITLEQTIWRIWINPRADGSVMHENSIATWNGFETDAYALILRKQNGETKIGMVAGSFLRHRGNSLLESLSKQALSIAEVGS